MAHAIQLKIKRADKHIDDLNILLRKFIDSKPGPYTVGTKHDPQTKCLIYYVVRAKPLPVDVPLIAGDILQNLRTALDYLVCALVRANGGDDGRSAFPICNQEPISDQQKARFDTKINGMRDEAKEIIRRIKPYKGGDNILWSLHALNNRDKHRLLFTVGAAFKSFDIGAHASGIMQEQVAKTWGIHIPKISLTAFPADRKFPLKAGDALFIDAPNAKPNNDIKFTFDIALDELGVVAGESLITVIRVRQQRVMQVIEMFAGMY
jgi:hypothetical protein